MKPTRILLDLDEVLANFIDGALACHGWTRDELEAIRVSGHWPINQPMGLTDEAFWEPIRCEGEDFWLGLSPLPWIDDLIQLVESVTSDWHVISSPPRYSEAYSGKEKWLRRQFGSDFDRFALTPHKHIFACRNALLIDDSERNIRNFIANGGMGLIFPNRGNYRHEQADDPISFLTPFFTDWTKEPS